MINSTNIFRLAVIFAITMLIQVAVLDNLDILGLCNPFLYVVFILSIPFGTSAITTMLLSLPAGLAIDLASNTPGMHSAACVLIGYLRPRVHQLIAYRSSYKEGEMPSSGACGTAWYAKYTLIMVSIHHVALFFIEQFDRLCLPATLLRIVLSILGSSLLIMLFQFIMPRDNSAASDY